MDVCLVPVALSRRYLTNILVVRIVRAGMLKVAGVMPPKCKMFDTPGVPHKFQLTSRLSADEVWPPSDAEVCPSWSMWGKQTCLGPCR